MGSMNRREFGVAALAMAAAPLGFASALAAPANPRRNLEAFRNRARHLGVRALVVANSRDILLSDGEVSEVSRIASIRKSFVSALFGIAVADGRIDLDRTLAQLGVDDYLPLSELEKSATISQLLQARSGVYIPTAAETPAMRAARPARGSHAPGSFWYYNNWDFNVLGEIYQRTTQEDLFAAIEHRLLRPLGFQDFEPLRDLRWGYDPQSPRFPAYNMWMSARDMVRFGQLFLRRGEWQGRRIVPESWVMESTTPRSTTGRTGWNSGYAYLWWVASDLEGASTAGLPVGSFTAAGNGGRYITIFPDHDLVVSLQPEEVQGQPQAELYTDPQAYTNLLKLLFA